MVLPAKNTTSFFLHLSSVLLRGKKWNSVNVTAIGTPVAQHCLRGHRKSACIYSHLLKGACWMLAVFHLNCLPVYYLSLSHYPYLPFPLFHQNWSNCYYKKCQIHLTKIPALQLKYQQKCCCLALRGHGLYHQIKVHEPYSARRVLIPSVEAGLRMTEHHREEVLLHSGLPQLWWWWTIVAWQKAGSQLRGQKKNSSPNVLCSKHTTLQTKKVF